MAYDEELVARVRKALGRRNDVREQKMFGGLTFMVSGNMACGVEGDRLMVRVGPERLAEALALPHAHPMDFTGRPMTGFVFVDAKGVSSDKDLQAWVERGVDFALSLPPK